MEDFAHPSTHPPTESFGSDLHVLPELAGSVNFFVGDESQERQERTSREGTPETRECLGGTLRTGTSETSGPVSVNNKRLTFSSRLNQTSKVCTLCFWFGAWHRGPRETQTGGDTGTSDREGKGGQEYGTRSRYT